jgi:hypothetical protein
MGFRPQGGPPPAWARLDGLARGLIVVITVLLFGVSGGMLWLIGYNYDGLTGGAATKIHPSTYLIVIAFAWTLIASGRPVERMIHLVNRRPATLLLLIVSCGTLAVVVLRDGPGLGGLVDTYIACCLLMLLLADEDEALFDLLRRLVHVLMTANALLALGEFVTNIRLFPYRFDGLAFETDTRSAGLHGHPLANALITACYLLALCNGDRGLPPWFRAGMIGLQSAALVVFGGRTAVLAALGLGFVYGAAMFLRLLKEGRVPLLGAAIGFMLAALLPAAVGALVALGFFDALAARFVSDGGSANARREMFELLAMFPVGDLILGPDIDLVDSLRRVNGLEWGIENPIIRMVLYQGAILTLLLLGAFTLFMVELVRITRLGLWLPMVVWIILLNGAETISTKTTLTSKFALMALVLYRPDRRAGPAVNAAWTAPERRSPLRRAGA